MTDNKSQRISRPQPRRASARGFTLLEALIGISIILIMAAMAIIKVQPMMDYSAADTGLQFVLGKMRSAHQSSIDMRRQYRVTFIAPATITTEHLELVSGVATWIMQTPDVTSLPGSTQFTNVGIPTGSSNTPDQLGTGAFSIDFDVDNGGGQNQIIFFPDGRVLDSVGRINNGTVYIATPGKIATTRAVSMYGTTGRMKAWTLSVGSPNTWVAR